jgi:two-component system, OmpR family, osmolarity sensor histidine kinase EnvZ
MHWLPRSLAGRVTWLVGLISVASLIAQLLLLRTLLFEPFSEGMLIAVVGEAHQAQQNLLTTPPDERDRVAVELSYGPFWVGRSGAPDGGADIVGPLRQPSIELPGGLQDIVTRSLGHDAVLDISDRNGLMLRIEADIDGERWNFVHRHASPRNAPTITLLALLALLFGTAALSLWIGFRVIALPLKRLAHEIATRRGALRAIELQPGASDELQQIARAFNSLARSVDEADRTRGQLLAGVSHDLRTPLSRLRLRIETQCDESVGDALLQDLGSVQRIVDQFLAYVQGGADIQLGRLQPLWDTGRAVVAMYADPGVMLRGDGVDELLPDIAVQRLLSNLIDNALAYGQRPVTVDLCRCEGGVSIAVFDHGPGLNDAEFAQALQPFVRLDRQRSSLGHCGLGLAIVSQIARQIGGTLSLARAADGAFGIALTIRTTTAIPDATLTP